MTKRTKALGLTKKVKDAVWARDKQCCVLCGNPEAMPNAHVVARSHGGMGIEQNVVTLCRHCHDRYDHTAERGEIRMQLEEYLAEQYPGWDTQDMVYSKYPRGYGIGQTG